MARQSTWIFSLAILFAAATATAQNTGSIAGQVTDSVDGRPVGGVSIVLESPELSVGTFTDADGQFQFEQLPASNAFVVFTRFADNQGFIDEGWQDRLCSREYGCDPNTFDPIAVGIGEAVTGINLSLDRLGTIEGEIRQAVSGATLQGIQVDARFVDGGFAGRATTDAFGRYRISRVYPGDVVVYTRQPETIVDEIYDNHPCTPDCDLSLGDPVQVVANETTAGIDFALDPGAAIQGTTVDAASGVPAARIDVRAYNLAGTSRVRSTQSGTDGRFSLTALPAGSYLVVSLGNDRFAATLYENVPCPGDGYNPLQSCSPDDGTPITLGRNQTVDGITLRLQELGVVSGTVTRAEDGLPLANTEVRLRGDYSSYSGVTDNDGRYQVGGIPPGAYFATADAYGGERLPVVWENVVCVSCDPRTEGSPIVIGLNQQREGIDFALPKAASISGRVLNGLTLEPIRSARASLFNQDGSFIDSDSTDSDGRYRLERLAPGTYFIQADEFGFASQLWNGIPCDGGCDPTTGTPIVVDFGDDATDLDFRLDFPTGILGRVTHAETGDPLQSVSVALWDTTGNFVASQFPSDSGRYQFLPGPGTYFVSTESGVDPPYSGIDEVYDDIPCPPADQGGCRPLAGTPVTITETTVATDIDFALAGFAYQSCQPSDQHLCLANGRFLATATWRTPDGRTGRAGVEQLTDESGYFWFFRPGNVEAIVKVLDACGASLPHFWTFAAGLTNLEVELTVVDTFTNDINTYQNGAGVPFLPIQDTRAFATCDMFYDPFLRPGPRPDATPTTTVRRLSQRTPTVKGTTCTPSDTAMCLGPEGRFRVEASWRRFDDGTGNARAVPLAPAGSAEADTGYMWFFRSDNVEVIVKVLDACDSASNRFWVFAGGLTNVQVDLRVTDTVTGEVKTYFNQLGQPFQPIVDTQAFDTCDVP